MTDRFSHPLSIQPTTTSSQRSRQSPSRASISSRASASQPAGRVDRTRTDRSRQETTFLSPQAEQDARSYKTQTRSRASTASRSRIPEALQGVGREELDIYLVRWDLLGDDELARACGVHLSSSTSTGTIPGSSLTSTRPRATSPSTSTSNPLSDATAPRLTRSSSSLSSLQTPKPRPRPLKRLSTQILALTLPPSEHDTIDRENAASSFTSPSLSYQNRRAEGLFPPSPPGDRPDFEFGESHDQDGDSLKVSTSTSDTLQESDRNGMPSKDSNLHPLRVLSRLTRELGEACLRLEEENRELRLRPLTQEEELGFERSRDVAGGLVTPTKRSDAARAGWGVEEVEGGGEVGQMEPADGRDMDNGVVGGRRLSSVFREEDQVSLRLQAVKQCHGWETDSIQVISDRSSPYTTLSAKRCPPISLLQPFLPFLNHAHDTIMAIIRAIRSQRTWKTT